MAATYISITTVRCPQLPQQRFHTPCRVKFFPSYWGTSSRALLKRSAKASEAADMNDRYLPMDTAKYVDYGIITGIEADPS